MYQQHIGGYSHYSSISELREAIEGTAKRLRMKVANISFSTDVLGHSVYFHALVVFETVEE